MTEESGLPVTEELDVEALIEQNNNFKKKLGDQGNEIGDLRRSLDTVLQQQIKPQVEEDDWYADPTEKKVNALEGKLNSLQQTQALRELEQKHPGFRDLPKDESFAGWVANSQYRSNLYQKADNLDLTAADELFTAWEEQQESANGQHQAQRTNRNKALNDASMEKGSAGGMRKTYWKRSELIDMRIHNPQKYEANREEILKAYAEGRVRK